MKYLYQNKLFTLFFTLITASFLLTSCDTTGTDDHDDDHDDEHSDALGYVIELNNAEILRFENNQYIWNPTGTWDAYFREFDDEQYFTLSPDVIDDMERGMTPTVTVRWLDHDGDVFDLPQEADGGDFGLDWDWEKPNTLTEECSDDARESAEDLELIRPANLEQHGEDGSWGFHFRADHAGQDRIRFKLMHDGHADFVSGWFTVVVAHDDHDLIDENGVYLHERDKCRVR
jgi:hypothetical protein